MMWELGSKWYNRVEVLAEGESIERWCQSAAFKG